MPTDLPIPPDHLHHPGPLLIGFSGGLDSSVLLHRLANDRALRARGVCAIHIHHGLHPDADQWQRHCAKVCEALHIPLRCLRVDVPKDSGEGPEASARKARHAAFAQELPPEGILTLAHHQDDQAETVLLRALRGSGVDGLAAMRPWRRFAHGWLWRPLLDLPRARLLDYARAHALTWIEDSSNADPRFERNYLRHAIMPKLAERWPHAAARLAHVARLQAQAQALLDADLETALAACQTESAQTLSVSSLYQHPPARRARLLRAWVRQLGLPPLPGHAIPRIETDLLSTTPGEHACLRWKNASITRWRDLLHAARVRASLPPGFSRQWHPHTPLSLPDGGQLALIANHKIPAGLCWQVHARRGGERIVLPGRCHSHTLKHVLQQHAIPPWLRTHLPLVSDPDGELLAVADRMYSDAFKRWLDTHQARLVWR